MCVQIIVGEKGGRRDVGPHNSLRLAQVMHTIDSQCPNTSPATEDQQVVTHYQNATLSPTLFSPVSSLVSFPYSLFPLTPLHFPSLPHSPSPPPLLFLLPLPSLLPPLPLSPPSVVFSLIPFSFLLFLSAFPPLLSFTVRPPPPFTHLLNPDTMKCLLLTQTSLAPLLPSGPSPSFTGVVEVLGSYTRSRWSLPRVASSLPSRLHASANSWVCV